MRSESGQSGYLMSHPSKCGLRIDQIYPSDWSDGSSDIWSIRWILIGWSDDLIKFLVKFHLALFLYFRLTCFFNFAIGESFLILWLRLAWCPLFSVGLVLISVDGLEFFNFAIGESFLILWLRLAWCSLFHLS